MSSSPKLSPDLPSVSPEAVGLSPAALERAVAVLREDVSRGLLPGAVALVAREGRIAWFEALGTLDPARDAPMSRDAIFRIYSMTKPIVSVATMMLVEQGRALLSDPVGRWLPEFAAPQVDAGSGGELAPRPARQPITVQDLLRHTSGLTYEFLGESPVQRLYAETRIGGRHRTNAQMSEALGALPLLHEPGTRWAYGRSTDVLGRLVEVLADRPLGEFLDERIHRPLGMVDTGFAVPPDQHHRIAEPFATDPDTGEAVRLIDVRRPAAFESGGGGLVSTAADYARFLQMLAGGGRLGGERLLSRKTVELMTADHLGGMPVDTAGNLLPAGHGFGLGFAVRTHQGLAPVPGSVGQYFWGGIAGTTFWVDPRERLFAILMIQAPGRRDHYRQTFRNLVHAAIED